MAIPVQIVVGVAALYGSSSAGLIKRWDLDATVRPAQSRGCAGRGPDR